MIKSLVSAPVPDRDVGRAEPNGWGRFHFLRCEEENPYEPTGGRYEPHVEAL